MAARSPSPAALSRGASRAVLVENDRAALDAQYNNRARIPDHRWRDPIQPSALAIKGLMTPEDAKRAIGRLRS